MIQERILELVKYGLTTGLVDPADEVYTVNRLLEVLGVDEIEDETFEKVEAQPAWTQEEAEGKLEGILAEMMDYAYENGLMAENSIVYKDLFDTKIMGCLVPEPSSVRKTFRDLYEHTSPLAATDYFYKLSCDSNYIRRQRIKKDRKWTTDTEFGTLDITINLSKPEKDPKAIAAAKNAKQSAYPKCQLCKENEGYAGRVNHPARQNHRIIPLTINNSDWFFQYSPYVYYNEHCIVFNSQHTPMKIERATFRKLLDFVGLFPHYFVGSNADLPIVGGSILSHSHFQGGRYVFPMQKADKKDDVLRSAFNQYFGLDFTGIVLNEIREKRSMAYTAYAFVGTQGIAGKASYLRGYIGTQNDKANDALDVLMGLVNDMPKNPERIDNIKSYLRQAMLTSHPSFRNKAMELVDLGYRGYTDDPAKENLPKVDALTFDDIVKFYEENIKDKPYCISIMGNPKNIDLKRLEKFGKVVKLNERKLFNTKDALF